MDSLVVKEVADGRSLKQALFLTIQSIHKNEGNLKILFSILEAALDTGRGLAEYSFPVSWMSLPLTFNHDVFLPVRSNSCTRPSRKAITS